MIHLYFTQSHQLPNRSPVFGPGFSSGLHITWSCHASSLSFDLRDFLILPLLPWVSLFPAAAVTIYHNVRALPTQVVFQPWRSELWRGLTGLKSRRQQGRLPSCSLSGSIFSSFQMPSASLSMWPLLPPSKAAMGHWVESLPSGRISLPPLSSSHLWPRLERAGLRFRASQDQTGLLQIIHAHLHI